jgi:hypothetical protein
MKLMENTNVHYGKETQDQDAEILLDRYGFPAIY